MSDTQQLAKDVFKQVKNLFIWQSDQENYNLPEHWKSYADDVEAGRAFRQDCDGFALTCAELLIRQGADPADVRLVFCRTETGEYHLVCIADQMVLDNRQRAVWHWTQIRYDWISSMRMDNLGVWREAE